MDRLADTLGNAGCGVIPQRLNFVPLAAAESHPLVARAPDCCHLLQREWPPCSHPCPHLVRDSCSVARVFLSEARSLCLSSALTSRADIEDCQEGVWRVKGG